MKSEKHKYPYHFETIHSRNVLATKLREGKQYIINTNKKTYLDVCFNVTWFGALANGHKCTHHENMSV